MQHGEDVKKSRRHKSTNVGAVQTTTNVADYFVELQKKDGRVLALFPTNEEVERFNVEVMAALGLDVVTIEAVDSDPRTVKRRSGVDDTAFTRVYQKKAYPIVDKNRRKSGETQTGRKSTPTKRRSADAVARLAGGLEKTLKLAVNGRIMLRRNINNRLLINIR